MKKIKEIWADRKVRFGVVALLYTLVFVVWTGNLWLLLGLPIIYDIYISKIMNRLVWSKHKAKKKSSKAYRVIMDWVDAIVFAVIVATLVKVFLFGMYVIPTPSMERTLMVGDYLYVSKLRYGPSMPVTPLSVPLVHNTMPFSQTKKSYSEAIKWKRHRLKGIGKVKRGDVVVFNFPAGDTVVMEHPAAVYYDIMRGYQERFEGQRGREQLYKDYTVVSRPVDKRENYVKRCVGLPGDMLQVIDTELIVNDTTFEVTKGMQFHYTVQTNGTPISHPAFEQMGISLNDVYYNQVNKSYEMSLTTENLERVKSMSNVVSTRRYVSDNSMGVFPHDSNFGWSEDNFGPIWIPKKGDRVILTLDNLPLYKTIIENYEGHRVEVKGEVIHIDGTPSSGYLFEMDYYFMMGDNRHNSSDSRFWGFVPEDHIVGKASFIWMSTDAEKGSFPLNIRWKRLFSRIK